MDATHLCQQRASGAQNWEAWIKDTRDEELYRIVYMPDDKWWLAQNVKYAGAGSVVTNCSKDDCGRAYSYAQAYASYAGGSSSSTGNVQGVCPTGWLLPIGNDWSAFVANIHADQSVVCARLRANNSTCSPRDDYYGWANKINVIDGNKTTANASGWYSNSGVTSNRHWGLGVDWSTCNTLSLAVGGAGNSQFCSVRCFRQL
jgi:uncharacterized protein (TIGR02145 family)